MRDDKARLNDVLEAIEHIEKYAVKGRTAFEAEELIQVWFLRHLQIIGEASRTMSSSLKDIHPEIPWAKIIGMCHILVHDYFGIDLPLVWNVVERELPDLKKHLTAIIRELGEA
ncbi:MAG: HepT-like ribonuclease domain-containing protein [Desulfobaccales bacterium]